MKFIMPIWGENTHKDIAFLYYHASMVAGDPERIQII